MQGTLRVSLSCLLVVSLLLCPSRGQAFLTVASEEEEKELGRKVDDEVVRRFGLYEDPALWAYVESVGQRLVRVADATSFQYRFKILDTPDFNAMALPGGYIYVTRGLLAFLNSEAQLAGVLGHEIGHVTAHHAVRRGQQGSILQMAALALAVLAGAKGGAGTGVEIAVASGALVNQILLGYTREAEREADELGLHYMAKAGYEPQEFVALFRARWQEERRTGTGGYHAFATHPETSERLARGSTLAGILASRGGDLEVRGNEYRAHLKGLVYGEKRDAKKLGIYTAQKGDSFSTIAQVTLGDKTKGWELALFNGMKEDTVFHGGEIVKIIPR